MAADEDTELRDLLLDTLEKKGILGKIKAELRASVFLALEEQDDFKKKLQSKNQRSADSFSTEIGRIAASLVRDFLEYFDLKFTQEVFGCEAQFEHLKETEILSALGLSGSNEQPLLFHLIGLIQTWSTDKQRQEGAPRSEEGDHAIPNQSVERSPLPGNQTYVVDGSTPREESKRDLTKDGDRSSPPSHDGMGNLQRDQKPEVQALGTVEPTASALSSSKDLPLINGFVRSPPADAKDDDEDDPRQLPSEEKSTKQGDSLSGSGLENSSIEEELEEDTTNADDILNSLSLGDDITADYSISRVSNLEGCDYTEAFQNG